MEYFEEAVRVDLSKSIHDQLTDIVNRAVRKGYDLAKAELIHCKDCKYFINSNEKCQLIETRLHFYERDKRWTEDSFCSWAERKTE